MSKYPWKTAWIVGGSTGLGAEAVKQLDAAGVRVLVSARSADVLNDLAKPLIHTMPLPLDITDEEKVHSILYAVKDAADGLPDLIILNAAVYSPMGANNFNANVIKNMMDVNYVGLVNVLAALMPFKDCGKQVTIAAVGSPSGWRGLPGGVGYGPTKAALINLIEGLKPELDKTDFDLRLVNPGFIRTRLTDKNAFDMPQLMEPDYAAMRMLTGLAKGKFDTAFPNPFVFTLKLLRLLPYKTFFAITRRMLQKQSNRLKKRPFT